MNPARGCAAAQHRSRLRPAPALSADNLVDVAATLMRGAATGDDDPVTRWGYAHSALVDLAALLGRDIVNTNL